MGPHEDYIETVFTCEGDFHDPHLKDRLEDFKKSLKDLLLTDKKKLILKKVEPWNSVRVTFKIPREAALRLKQLAQQGNSTLRELGVLAVKIQDQNISLTIAGRNNECTQLVFRTAESSQEITPSLSVYGTNSPSLDELRPQGPGPSHLETASKNIAEYLQKGPALLDFFSQHAAGENILGPQCDLARMKINNILSERGIQQKSLQQATTQSGHHGLALSLSANSLSPNRSLVGQDKFPQVPGLHPGFPPGPSRHGLDNLPPPPPYPEGSSYMNSLQKLHLSSTGPSQLLVNLLQNDPNFSNLLAAGRNTPSLDPDSLQPPKKKRKPRKPREKKKVAEQHVSNIAKSGFTGPAAETNSMSLQIAPSVTNSSFLNLESNVAISEHVFKTVAQTVMHNTYVQSKSEQIVPLTNTASQRRLDECDTTGKIINPVTGLLEPMENLSDASPAKSDGGKQSPHSLVQGTTGTVENSIHSPLEEGNNVVGYPDRPPLHPNQGNQRTISDHSNSVSLSLGQTMQFSSSQFGSNPSSGLLHQKTLDEVVKLEMTRKTWLKKDVVPPISKVDQTLSYCASQHSGIIHNTCDKSSADDMQGKKEMGDKKKEVIPQENDTKSIPLQLLNKPLLQVKHESVTGKPPGSSPDSNVDSECSTQSLNLDTHTGSDPGGQSGPQIDPKTYNNDSGVGSCSERSDDTPSDPGDSDYKSSNTNLIECAKPSLVEPMQQGLPNSKTVTVGYALTDTRKDIINHKIVSPFLGSDKLLNSSLDKTTFKTEKLDICPTSQSHLSQWAIEEQRRIANNVNSVVKQAVHDSINRKSPKLSALLPKSLHHGKDGQPNSMQGYTEPLSMHKKASPRSSPRSSSPRTPGSPRNTSSPRGSSSPRTVDPIIAVPSHQAFLELPAHVLARESQNKPPYSDQCKSFYSEQRKSPYNVMSTPHSAFSPEMLTHHETDLNSVDSRTDRNHVGMETFMGMPQQCNTDISLLKSLEAARQLNLLAAAKNVMHLKKMEPKFQKFHQMNFVQSMANDVENLNRVDNVNHALQSSAGHLSKNNGPNFIGIDVHMDNAVVQNCGNAGPLSVVNTSSNSDRDNSIPRTNSKGSKLHSEELKGATNSTSRRSSPGVASNSSNPLHHSYDSTLPQPKRLTESVQKLLTLPLLDNHSLPHVNRRSPLSSTSATKLTSIATGISNSRGSVSLTPVVTSSRNTTGESSHIDLDFITPSITGFGLESLDFHLDTSRHSHLDIVDTEHSHVPSVDYHPVDVSHPIGVSSISPTKLVPVLTGVVPFSEPGESIVLNNASEPHTSVAGNHNGHNIQIPVVRELQEIACNSDSKMASSHVIESKTMGSLCATQCGPPMLQSQNVWYPVHKHSEQPKSPCQQMGHPEVLQVTASLHSLTGRLSPSPSVLEKALSSQIQKVSSTDTDKSSKTTTRYVENLECNLEPQCCQSSSVGESKQSEKCDIGNIAAKSPENRDNSDIPKLKRQTSVLNTKSFNFNAATISGTLCDSDLDKSQDSYSSNNSTPPVLTAESVELENNSECTYAVMVQNDIVSETSNNHVTVGCSEPNNTNSEKSFNKSNLSETEENSVDEKNTLQTPILVSNPLNPSSEHLRYPVPEISEAPDDVINVHAMAESVEERFEYSGLAPRQLRSRKRTFELDVNALDDSKRIKFDSSPETSTKFESANDPIKVQGAKLNSSVSSLHDVKVHEDNFHRESVKSGLRARTNSKNLPADNREKAKQPSGRESRKDGKAVSGKPIDQKSKAVKVEDSKRNQQLRCHRQSSSVASPAKQCISQATRDKSPVCASIARCHNLPVVMDTNEDCLENKRTTRSAKCKATKGDQSSQPQGKTNPANKHRRTTSQDHRGSAI